MNEDREREKRTYALCRVGFGILAFALAVACLSMMISLPRIFIGRAFLPWLQESDLWKWKDVPIVWGSLVGAYLLWGRWRDPSWQRRSGLLVLMSTVDLVLWFVSHGDELGLRLGDLGHLWLREMIGEALGWAEFALMASLACDVLVHLGVAQAADTGRGTRSLAATGAVVWIFFFWAQTDWHRGWPLIARGPTLETVLLFLGTQMIWMLTLIQVTAIALAASRRCGAVVAEMEKEDGDHDLLRLPSELAEPPYRHGD